MRGILLHYNFESHQGLIRGEDGRRYAFYGEEWRSNGSPATGDELDFEAEGTGAYDIYVVRPAAATQRLHDARGDARASQARNSARAGNGANRGSGLATNGIAQRLLADWTVIIALVTLLGCLLPYISFGAGSQSLFGVGLEIGRAIDGMNQIESLGRAFAPTRGQAAQQQKPPKQVDMSAARWSLRLGYLLYIIPALSFGVIALGFMQRPLCKIVWLQGLSCILLPVVVPVLLSIAIYAQLPADLKQMMGRTGVRIDISFLGLGFWVIVLSGIAQILNLFGYIRKRPMDLIGSR